MIRQAELDRDFVCACEACADPEGEVDESAVADWGVQERAQLRMLSPLERRRAESAEYGEQRLPKHSAHIQKPETVHIFPQILVITLCRHLPSEMITSFGWVLRVSHEEISTLRGKTAGAHSFWPQREGPAGVEAIENLHQQVAEAGGRFLLKDEWDVARGRGGRRRLLTP